MNVAHWRVTYVYGFGRGGEKRAPPLYAPEQVPDTCPFGSLDSSREVLYGLDVLLRVLDVVGRT
jgi:hypothetical protein